MPSPLTPPRRLLYGPGPSMVDPNVYAELAKPIVGHLDPFFFGVLEETSAMLRQVFGAAENSFTTALSGTGSSGMEAAVANFIEPGQKFAVFANGYFCDRITEMARRQGADVVRLEKPWGEVFEPAEAAGFLDREKPAVAAFVHAETSTGALQDGAAICQAAHACGALVIADCVTSLGAMPVEVDKTGIDVAYSCSQKGLGCPPGLAPITLSERALERLRARKSSPPTWYLDLKLIAEYMDRQHRYHHTAPISMFYALHRALALALEEGLENRWARHCRAHKAFVKGIEGLGMRMHVAEGHRVWSLNTPSIPDGVDELKVRRKLFDDQGIEIFGGFGPLAGKIFRIGLMSTLATEESANFLLEQMGKAL